MSGRRLFLCASHSSDPGWHWIADRLPGEYAWRFVDTTPRNLVERRVKRPYVARYRAGVEAAWRARGEQVDLLVSHGPLITSSVGLAQLAFPSAAPHLAFAFNFTTLPRGARHALMRRAFRRVDRFVVPSTLERELYSAHFEIPPEKIDTLKWGVQRPVLPPGARPVVEGDYVCALGGEGRDYATLVEAMRLLPRVRLVIVARPHNLAGISLPDNVQAFTNLPVEDAWNILAFSRLAAVPLRDSEVPCGHVTLVAAMYLKKALVITASRGVTDYVEEGVTGLTCAPRDPAAFARRIEELWEDAATRERLGDAAERFVAEHCSEEATIRYFEAYLREKSLAG